MLEPERGAYAFRHTLLREAVYEELLPGERVRLHSAYATALAHDPSLAEGVAEAAAELAHHSFAAHDLEQALTASVEAAELATRRWGFGEARVHCERALELWDRVPEGSRPLGGDRVALLRRAAEAANLEGDHRRAAELVRAALPLVDEEADPERAGILYTRLGRFLWAAGEGPDALSAYEQALELVPSDPPSDARGRVLAARGQALMLTARHAESADCCREAIAIAQRTGARAVEGHAMNTLGVDLAHLGDASEAVEQLRAARDIAEEVGDLDDLARAHQNLADTLVGVLGRPAEAVEEARLGVERCRALGLGRDYGVSLQAIAATGLLELGRWDEADAELRDAAAANPMEMAAVDLLHTRIPLLVGRGDFDRAGEDLARARRLTIHTIDPQYVGPRCAHEAQRALWLGQPEEARAAVDEGLGHIEGTDDVRLTGPLLWLGAWAEAELADRARAQRADGRLAESEAALERLLDRARSLAGGDGTMPAYLALCEAESGRARRASDPSAWAAAAGAWTDLERPYPAAYAALAPGRGAAGRAPQPRRGAGPARGPRHGAAPGRRAAGPRARAPGPPGPDLPRGRFRASAAGAGGGRPRADPARARGARAGRRGPHEPGDRRGAVREREDRRPPRLEHPAQARGPQPGRGRRGGPAARAGRLDRDSRTRRPRTASLVGVRIMPIGLNVIASRRWSTSAVASISSSGPTRRSVATRYSGSHSPAARSSPVTVSRSPSSVAVSERKRTCGWASTPKKSSERRCLSRLALFVSMLPASIASSIAGSRRRSSVPS